MGSHARWRISLGALLAACACAHAPAPANPLQPPAQGPLVPFRYDPPIGKPWGLRVARHRTLPSPTGGREAIHFDSEESSRVWVERAKDGGLILDEVLTNHSETKNGDPDADPILAALEGVTVGIELTPEGRWVSAVDPAGVLGALARNWTGGGSGFERMPPEVFSRELERDWRLGAQVYLERPIHAGEPVYSLMSVSLPQLPSLYVVVEERFGAPLAGSGGAVLATGAQELYGRSDPRYRAAIERLGPLLAALQVREDELVQLFNGSGTETVDVHTLEVLSSSYQGEGVFPLVTPRGTFPLRFLVEEIAGEIAPPALPLPHDHVAAR